MAELRKIVRRDQLSNFRGPRPQGRQAFAALADMAQSAYEALAPAAEKEMRDKGIQAGRDYARRQIGENRPAMAGVSQSAQGSLDALQKAWGEPLKITSGYRDPEHNARVGGAKNSQHTHGNAFDVDVSHYSQEQRLDLIRQARAAGFRGIGVYENSLHFDVGPDRAWGPSYGRESLPGWAADAVQAPIGQAPVTIRTSSGALEPRLFSPISGPLLQAYNAAAGVAYAAETTTQSMADMMSLSQQYEGNPDGFLSAARGYVDGIVEQAPPMFREDLRADVEKEMQRRYLGMMDAKHRETRVRADNSSKALVDRYAQDYAEALAAGNEEEAATILESLNGVLSARESLPGVAWTPEQSENIRIAARDEAAKMRDREQKRVLGEMEDQANIAITANLMGTSSEYDGMVNDPEFNANFPDMAMELRTSIALRQDMPRLMMMPPAQRAAEFARMAARTGGVDTPEDISMLKMIRGAADNAASMWEDENAVEIAQRFAEDKPPAFPDITTATTDQIIKSFAARAAYMNERIIKPGLTDARTFLTGAESQALSSLLGGDAPAITKAAVLGAVTAGFGADAEHVLNQLDVADPVPVYVGKLVARGMDPIAASQALVGQELIKSGSVNVPEAKVRDAATQWGDVGEALVGLPPRTAGEIQTLANAFYAVAAQGKNVDNPSDTYGKAVQKALGQQERNGKTYGGVQDVFGHPTLLPVNMTPSTMMTGVLTLMREKDMRLFRMDGVTEIKSKASDSMFANALRAMLPLTGTSMRSSVKIVPYGGNQYRLEYASDGEPIMDQNGNMATFSVDEIKRVSASALTDSLLKTLQEPFDRVSP